MLPCEGCTGRNAKQKSELETVEATKPIENIYADMNSATEIDGSNATYQNMWVMVDQLTDYKRVRQYKTKDEMLERNCEEI
jgi:hypothetical protein